MSTQLTISIELITFMEWVLKYKSDAFAAFITEAVDPELREKLAALAQDRNATVSSNKLYETLSTFVRFIEHNLQIMEQPETSILGARRSKRHAKGEHGSTRRRAHAAHCPAHTTEVSEMQSIQSPTQRTLYRALFSNENNSESGVH